MFEVGDRVVFMGFGEPDPYSPRKPGDLGTVDSVGENSIQGRHAWVRFDDGGVLAMLLDKGDRIEKVGL